MLPRRCLQRGRKTERGRGNEGRKRKEIVTGSNNDVQSKGVELNCVQSITIRNAKGGKKKPLPATSPEPRVKESGKSSQIATEEKEKNKGSKEVKTDQYAESKKVKKNSKTMDKDWTMPESKGVEEGREGGLVMGSAEGGDRESNVVEVSKGRPTTSKKGLDRKAVLQSEAILAVKKINGIPYMKDISAKDWQYIFRSNGQDVSINQINNSFKRKGEKKRPLTASMYITLREALKDPTRNLVLRRTVQRIESTASHHESIDVDTPPSVALPGQEVAEEEVPKAKEVQEALETVERWVNANGTTKEIDFFKRFSSRMESEVNKENKQKMIADYTETRVFAGGASTASCLKAS